MIAETGAIGGYRFTHPLVRETLYNRIPHTRRVRLHQQAATALERLWGDDPQHLTELAWHFTQAAPAGDVAGAMAYARKAGDHTLALLAYEEAARWYRAALRTQDLAPPVDMAERGELLLRLGEAYRASGDGDQLTETLKLAAGLARRSGDARQLARAALLMGEIGFGRPWAHAYLVNRHLVDLLEEALAALDSAGDESADGVGALRARVLARLATQLEFSEQRRRWDGLSSEAIALARRLGEPVTLAYTLTARHLAIWSPENVEERLALATESLHLAETVGDLELALTAHVWRRIDLLELGEGAASGQEIDAYARIAGRLRQPHYLGYTAMFRAARALREGRFDEAEHLAREALAVGERVQDPNAFWNYHGQIAVLRRDQGRLDEMEAIVRGFVAERPERFAWRCLLADLYAEAGRDADARREFELLAAHGFADVAGGAFGLYGLTTLAPVCVFLGDAKRAAMLYDLMAPFAHRHAVSGRDAAAYCGSVAHALGLVAALLAQTGGAGSGAWWDTAEQHFTDAQERHNRAGAPPWLVRTRVAYATAVRDRHRAQCASGPPACNHHERIRDLAEQALVAARGLGMARVAVQAQELLTDVLPQRQAPPPHGLTPREVEMLRLLAAGHSNPQIADALVVSVATVRGHTISIYGKIGVSGRAAAAAYALRHGILPPDTP